MRTNVSEPLLWTNFRDSGFTSKGSGASGVLAVGIKVLNLRHDFPL